MMRCVGGDVGIRTRQDWLGWEHADVVGTDLDSATVMASAPLALSHSHNPPPSELVSITMWHPMGDPHQFGHFDRYAAHIRDEPERRRTLCAAHCRKAAATVPRVRHVDHHGGRVSLLRLGTVGTFGWRLRDRSVA